jgi:hypothetical protein
VIRYLSSILALLFAISGLVFLGARQAWWPLPAFWMEILLFIFFITLVIGYNLLRLKKKTAGCLRSILPALHRLENGSGSGIHFFSGHRFSERSLWKHSFVYHFLHTFYSLGGPVFSE